MTRNALGWDLPPGVTSRMIDEAMGMDTPECEACGVPVSRESGDCDNPDCPENPDYDPTPWCAGCGARREEDCKCGPTADNE